MRSLTISQCATLACLLEVTVPKPGNVHRGADFDDLSFIDFLVSGVAIAPAMEAAAARSLGQTILAAIEATRQVVSTNTNLGIVLLLAPLASVPRNDDLRPGIARVLSQLTADDSLLVYRAIQTAQPGGMGNVDEMDVRAVPPNDLLVAMRHAAERDLIARQYATNFADLFDTVVPWLVENAARAPSLADAVILTHLQTLHRYGDSLIARKCGPNVSALAAAAAGQVIAAAGKPANFHAENYLRALADFDFWLRADGHRRNPGTTADMLAAAIFVGLREEKVNVK